MNINIIRQDTVGCSNMIFLNSAGSTLMPKIVLEKMSDYLRQEEQAVAGSGTLAQTLLQHDLVDEYRLMVHPAILGTGRQLYRYVGGRKKLRLIETKTFSTGTIVLVYHPDKYENSK